MFPTIQSAATAIHTNLKGLAHSAQAVNNAFSTGEEPIHAIDPADTENRPNGTLAQGRYPSPQEQVFKHPDAEPQDHDVATEFGAIAAHHLGVRANVAVIDAADRTIGTLLDIFV